MTYKITFEEIQMITNEDQKLIKLTDLTDEEEEIINPLIPPTSGIRMELMEPLNKADEYIVPQRKTNLFLRVFKSISTIAQQEIKKEQLGILLVSDDRPTANFLVEYCAKILAYDGHKLYFQKPTDSQSKIEAKDNPYYSRMGTPHGSASVALFDEIDVSIVITASHNELIWNGVKFYFGLPMPISGRVMQRVSEEALTYTKIPITEDFQVQYLDANQKNTQYIINLVQNIMDLSVLKDKSIVIWPYMGHAPEISEVFRQIGVNVHLIDRQMEPPNPTIYIDYDEIQAAMDKSNANLSILLDSDRDRVVIVLKNPDTGEIHTLMPNTLYSAMHNLLINEFDQKIINVRTIPSDPRCDNQAQLTFLTGVGYKHLGMILYGALGYEIESTKFQTGILYLQQPDQNEKITQIDEIKESIMNSSLRGDNIIMALWEESGGHTFNVLKIDSINAKISAVFRPIGDKYPAPALLVLAALIESGYDLEQAVDQSIAGLRTKIPANDNQKVKIVQNFAEREGKTISINKISYQINAFELVQGDTAIIHLRSTESDVYFRPSGTGPGVRIYIFGPAQTAEAELKQIEDYMIELFDLKS